ncbi:MAG: YafY family transcriptional regulator [Chloroflexota bacterium]|nr:YafY family transcriptional regulator [Chloroflexota bacterium]
MYHPTTRVLAVLEMLQVHRRLSGPELAERLEVDLRTVRRYVTMLQDLGIPVEAERGRYGGYRLRGSYRLPPLMFTDDEALAVTLGLMAARRLGLAVDAAAVEGALAKVERVLPAPVRERVSSIQATLVTDFSARPEMPGTANLIALSAAAANAQRVRINHQSAQGATTERTIDPYGIVYLKGLWYLPAYCHLRQDLRVFRLDRIASIATLDESFTPPVNFDSMGFVRQSLAEMPGLWRVEVVLQTTLDDARRRVPLHLATFEEVEGGVILRQNTEGLEEIARQLIWLGVPFIVRRPEELRDVLRQLASEISATANRAEPTHVATSER